MDLPYKNKFESLPDVPIQDLVDYFNLEYACSGKGDEFVESDFELLGIIESNGSEAMYWSVKNCAVHAIARPFEDGYILEMGDLPTHTTR